MMLRAPDPVSAEVDAIAVIRLHLPTALSQHDFGFACGKGGKA
jgi:hypothetical protein